MKLKDFIKLLDSITDSDPESEIGMYIPDSQMDELYGLYEEWERTKETGEYFDIDVEVIETEPHILLISPIRYEKLLAMPPKGHKIYPKDDALRLTLGIITGLGAALVEAEEKEKMA